MDVYVHGDFVKDGDEIPDHQYRVLLKTIFYLSGECDTAEECYDVIRLINEFVPKFIRFGEGDNG